MVFVSNFIDLKPSKPITFIFINIKQSVWEGKKPYNTHEKDCLLSVYQGRELRSGRKNTKFKIMNVGTYKK